MDMKTRQHSYIAPEAEPIDTGLYFTILCSSFTLEPIEEDTDTIGWDN